MRPCELVLGDWICMKNLGKVNKTGLDFIQVDWKLYKNLIEDIRIPLRGVVERDFEFGIVPSDLLTGIKINQSNLELFGFKKEGERGDYILEIGEIKVGCYHSPTDVWLASAVYKDSWFSFTTEVNFIHQIQRVVRNEGFYREATLFSLYVNN